MKKIELRSHVPERFPEELLLDGNRVQQILINLVSNAIKYTQRGQVVIEASLID